MSVDFRKGEVFLFCVLLVHRTKPCRVPCSTLS